MGEAGGSGDSPRDRFQLDALLDDLQARIDDVRGTRDRVHGLLEAVLSVGRGLDLPQVLRQVVEAAVVLVDAEYGALGVLGRDREGLAQFLPVGFTEQQIKDIGTPPCGRGVLGVLIRQPEPLRLEEVSQHPDSYGFPANHPPMHSFLGVPIRVRDEVFGNLYLTQKRGAKEFTDEDEAVLTTLAAAAGVAIENARLYEEARYRQQWLEANAEIVAKLLSGTDESQVLELVVGHARRIVHADLGLLAVPEAGEGAGDQLVVVVAHGAGDEAKGAVVARDASFVGAAAAEGVPVISADLANDVRAATGPARLAGMGPAVAVPMKAGERVYGVLLLARRDLLATFTEVETGPLLAFAGQAAIAMELAEQRRAAERLSLFEDRDRIARDLHDLAIQRLFASGMTLQSVARLVQQPEPSARLQRVVGDLDETIRIIRSAIFGLQAHEAGPTARGLRARTAVVMEEAVPTLGFTPSSWVEGAVDTLVPAEVADQAVAVLREALANVAKHARASKTEVSLDVRGQVLTLAVVDDGAGMPGGGRRSGLRNLADRAERLGGELELSRPDRGGTRLEWRVPLPADRRQQGGGGTSS